VWTRAEKVGGDQDGQPGKEKGPRVVDRGGGGNTTEGRPTQSDHTHRSPTGAGDEQKDGTKEAERTCLFSKRKARPDNGVVQTTPVTWGRMPKLVRCSFFVPCLNHPTVVRHKIQERSGHARVMDTQRDRRKNRGEETREPARKKEKN